MCSRFLENISSNAWIQQVRLKSTKQPCHIPEDHDMN